MCYAQSTKRGRGLFKFHATLSQNNVIHYKMCVLDADAVYMFCNLFFMFSCRQAQRDVTMRLTTDFNSPDNTWLPSETWLNKILTCFAGNSLFDTYLFSIFAHPVPFSHTIY